MRTSKVVTHLITLAFTAVVSFNFGCMYSFYKQEDMSKCTYPLEPSHRDKEELRQGFHGLKHHKTFVVCVILSSPKNFERRQTIRDTWLRSVNREKIMPLFVIGDLDLSQAIRNRIKEENVINKDILQLQLQDSYSSLTRKVLQTFVQVEENVEFKYLLKVDDDTFVNVSPFLDELYNSNYNERLYWGFFDGRAPVFRNDKSKWVEKNYIICDRYAPYALGGGYVLSHDLVRFLVENQRNFEIFHNEDVSVGTWLAALKINRVHDTRFNTEYSSRGCSNKELVSHKQTIQDMKAKQYNLEQNKVLCENEIVKFSAYQYNWNVPPSQCCQRNKKKIVSP